jgi:hypothetical protein
MELSKRDASLIRVALLERAELLLREAKSHNWSGPQNKAFRQSLRDQAAEVLSLHDRMLVL